MKLVQEKYEIRFAFQLYHAFWKNSSFITLTSTLRFAVFNQSSFKDRHLHHVLFVPDAALVLCDRLKENRETFSMLKTVESLPLRIYPLYTDHFILFMDDMPSKVLLNDVSLVAFASFFIFIKFPQITSICEFYFVEKSFWDFMKLFMIVQNRFFSFYLFLFLSVPFKVGLGETLMLFVFNVIKVQVDAAFDL